MDDLIERQKAIEVIDGVFPVDPMKSEYTQGIACGAALALAYIKQLPSAQPEIIHCRNCKYYHDSEGCFFSTAETEEDGFCSNAERRTDVDAES